METSDHELLRLFVKNRSEDAFRQMVDRHLNLVFATARRIVGDPQLAEETAQGVFVLLARKAAEIKSDQPLAGWLYHTTRHQALNAIRSEGRRRQREQTAAAMQPNQAEPAPELIAAELEQAMDELSGDDRDALVLRFLDNRRLHEVGTELGISEEAARKRVNRALEKLRGIFGKRGIALSTGLLATALAGEAVTAAPVALGTTITATALSQLTGLSTTTTAITATQGTMNTMNLLNLKTAAAILGAAALSVTSTYLVKEHEADKLRANEQSLTESQATAVKAQHQAASAIQFRDEQIASLKKDIADLPRLRGEITALSKDKVDLEKRLVALTTANAASGIDLPKKPTKAVGQIDTDHLVFAGFKTPMSTLQSFMWAVKSHDTNTMLQAMSFNGLPAKVREHMGGQLTAENAHNFTFHFSDGPVIFNIDSIEELSSNLAVLRISTPNNPGSPSDPVFFEKVGEDWKILLKVTEYTEQETKP